MDEFIEKPPVFWAEQWDGTAEHAMLLFREIKLHTGRIFAKIEVTFDDDGTKRLIPEFETERGERWKLRENYWLVLGPKGDASTMDHDVFTSRYVRKSR